VLPNDGQSLVELALLLTGAPPVHRANDPDSEEGAMKPGSISMRTKAAAAR